MSRPGFVTCVCALASQLLVPRLAVGTPMFMGLGDLPGGQLNSVSPAISADGSVVVGLSNSAFGFEAFRWAGGDGMMGLGDLSGGTFYSVATATSADGSVVVGVSRCRGTPESVLKNPHRKSAYIRKCPAQAMICLNKSRSIFRTQIVSTTFFPLNSGPSQVLQ